MIVAWPEIRQRGGSEVPFIVAASPSRALLNQSHAGIMKLLVSV
jgi:hypothetical protein